MKGGPELRLTSALAGGPISGRRTEAGQPKGKPQASSPFETLFARLHRQGAKETPGEKSGTKGVHGQAAAR